MAKKTMQCELGYSVATNGNWIAATRLDLGSSDPGNPWDFGSSLAIRENPNGTAILL